MAVQIESLKSIPYFSGLNPAELEAIRKYVFEKTAARDEVILLEGDTSDALYFVVSGVVKVFKTSAEGKEQIIRIVRPGESFNDVSVFDGAPNPTSAQAMGPVVISGITRNDLQNVLRDYPQVALNVNKVLAGQVRELMALVEDLSFKHVVNRVAKILLENAGNGAGSPPRLTQREMAAMAGTAREIIGRSLKALEQAHAIRLDRNRIMITDRETLREMAMMAPQARGRARPVGSAAGTTRDEGQQL
ncbi:MAG: Crp/Fnr family transcriptional regulator [Dehalococcoidia bacterium]|nr:Crp/Fnr family transcriptional regulator [Dehalococcoidia bacterium]